MAIVRRLTCSLRITLYHYLRSPSGRRQSQHLRPYSPHTSPSYVFFQACRLATVSVVVVLLLSKPITLSAPQSMTTQVAIRSPWLTQICPPVSLLCLHVAEFRILRPDFMCTILSGQRGLQPHVKDTSLWRAIHHLRYNHIANLHVYRTSRNSQTSARDNYFRQTGFPQHRCILTFPLLMTNYLCYQVVVDDNHFLSA